MPRKLKAVAKPGNSVVPAYITESRIYQKRTVTKRKLLSFEEAMLLLHIPEMAREYFSAIIGGLKVRDKVALDHTAHMLNYVQAAKGVQINIAQQMLAQNTAAGVESPVMGFDAFARHLAELRAGHALPAPETIDVQPEG